MIHAMRDASVNGNPDNDFLVKMMPHHQGAIDMAHAELKYGKDTQIKQMARKMIEDQQRYLVKMRRQLRRMSRWPYAAALADIDNETYVFLEFVAQGVACQSCDSHPDQAKSWQPSRVERDWMHALLDVTGREGRT